MLIPQELQLSLFRLQKEVDKGCFHALHVLNPFVYQCFGVKGDR